MNQHKSIVQELLVTGLTQKQLGVLLGKSQAWVGAVLADKFSDLKWADGEALRRLHAERVAIDPIRRAPAGDQPDENQEKAAA